MSLLLGSSFAHYSCFEIETIVREEIWPFNQEDRIRSAEIWGHYGGDRYWLPGMMGIPINSA